MRFSNLFGITLLKEMKIQMQIQNVLMIDGYTRKIRRNYISHDLVNIIEEFYQGLYPSQAIVPEFVKDLEIFYYRELFHVLSHKWSINSFIDRWSKTINKEDYFIEHPNDLNKDVILSILQKCPLAMLSIYLY